MTDAPSERYLERSWWCLRGGLPSLREIHGLSRTAPLVTARSMAPSHMAGPPRPTLRVEARLRSTSWAGRSLDLIVPSCATISYRPIVETVAAHMRGWAQLEVTREEWRGGQYGMRHCASLTGTVRVEAVIANRLIS